MFLFDQNLSRNLPLHLKDYFKDSLHIIDLKLQNANDFEIWKIAKERNLTIVSKDSDFYNLLMKYGYPPKIIWIKTGNIPTNEILKLLISLKEDINTFLKNKDSGLLEIYQ